MTQHHETHRWTPRLSTTSEAELVAGLAVGGSVALESLQVLRGRHMPALLDYARLCVSEERFAAQLCHQTLSTAVRTAAAGRVRPGGVRHSLVLLLQQHAAEWADDERRQRLEPAFVRWLFETGHGGAGHAAVGKHLLRAFWHLPQHEQEILWYTEVEPGGTEIAAVYAGIAETDLAYERDHALRALLRSYLQTYGASCDEPECRGYLRILDAQARSALPEGVSPELDAHLSACVRCEHALIELSTLYTAPRVALVPALIGYSGLRYAERVVPVRLPAGGQDPAHRHSASRRRAPALHVALAVLVVALAVSVVLGMRASA
ncbi:hypothetical protein [Streptomyces sp. NPDC058739]|uniref:hypothetical protein n=1 Tax=Streptomyces sp. NPDC058739 TaxID=3346618 RepID=UPI0036CDC9D2